MTHLRSILVIGLVFITVSDARGVDNRPLAGTAALVDTYDLSDRMVDGAHRFLDRKLAESIQSRQALWNRDLSSPAAYEKSVQANRVRFTKYIGVIDPPLSVAMERFGDERNPALVSEMDRWSAYQVRWPVLEGVFGEGLLLEPKGKIQGHVVAIPDADQTPEQLVGLAPGIPPQSQFARRLVENGFRVIVPVLIDRDTRISVNPIATCMTDQPPREWIYRQAYEMGRHVIGYDVRKVLSAVDWLLRARKSNAKIGVAGYGEGGLIAFYSAAVDRRIDACLVSGYFDSRQQVWQE